MHNTYKDREGGCHSRRRDFSNYYSSQKCSLRTMLIKVRTTQRCVHNTPLYIVMFLQIIVSQYVPPDDAQCVCWKSGQAEICSRLSAPIENIT